MTRPLNHCGDNSGSRHYPLCRTRHRLVRGVVAAAITLLLELPAYPAHGQQRMELAQAQARARTAAPGVSAIHARVSGAQAQANAAGRVLRHNPVLSGEFAPSGITGADDTGWSIGVDWTLNLSGSWAAEGDAARAELQAAQASREDALRQLDESVAIAFAQVAHGQRAEALAQRAVALRTKAAEAAQRRLTAGEGTMGEFHLARLELMHAQASLAEVHGELEVARLELVQLTASEPDVVVDDSISPSPRPALPNLEAAVARDPRVRAAQAQVIAARRSMDAARSSAWPEPTVGAAYEWSEEDIPAGAGGGAAGASWVNRQLLFRVSIPIPVVERNQVERARAGSAMQVAGAEEQAVRAAVRREILSRYAAYVAAAHVAEALEQTPAVVEREEQATERALAAGELTVGDATISLTLLHDAAARWNAAVRDGQIAAARWRSVASAK